MQIDPMAEWQRIAGVYRSMYDDELINLVADSQDLTDIARQVLDAELRRRGLGNISNPVSAQKLLEPMRERRAPLLGNQGGAPQLVIDHRTNQESDGGSIEYTWKTLLCECETVAQARQLSETLKLAGIDCWIDDPNAAARFRGDDLQYPPPRILVAADQLENARAVAANPIPREAIEESKELAADFEMPACPHCGSKDPALEGVNPFNSWRCEACGSQWTDSEGV